VVNRVLVHALRHNAVTIALKAAQDRAKERHEKQRTAISYQIGDRVWLHLDKKRFKGQHHKLLPIRYGPYTILEKVGEMLIYWTSPHSWGYIM
jgi:hypothetical protein